MRRKKAGLKLICSGCGQHVPASRIQVCKSKDRTIVEYALKESSKPIGVATYRMVTSVPNELRNDLPTPEQISKLLGD